MINNKKAFSLAEVLIAIGVIGFIAALLLPSLMNSTPDYNKVMFRRAYHSVEVAVDGMINADEEYPQTADTSVKVNAATYYRGFNYAKATSNGNENKFCFFFTNSLNYVGNRSCPAAGSTGYGYFITSDGMYWNIYNSVPDTNNAGITPDTINANNTNYEFPVDAHLYQTKVIVDVNGAKNPNCSADTAASSYSFVNPKTGGSSSMSGGAFCKDPDRFIFGIRYDGKIQVGCSSSGVCTSVTDSYATNLLAHPVNNAKN